MSHSPDCIFCKIIGGEIPSATVYEDEHVVAFMDIGQVTKGHTLLIPKDHQENIFELEEETAAHLFSTAPKIARALRKEFQPKGMNLVNNNGKAASQSVFHYHLHFIPRYDENDGFQPTWEDNSSDYSPEKLQEMAKAVQQNM
ncbi:HIT family protein [Thalassorhabdus alkalitolerans]|uniref:HIT family protein n=1 Tax=Thalassorhabdus alkalitolerans TaxID=2282697 RepID=A0ABW0YM93_9BACI